MLAAPLIAAQSLCAFAALTLACWGWGGAALRLAGVRRRELGAAGEFWIVWVGLPVILLLAQLWHLVLPIRAPVGIALAGMGIGLYARERIVRRGNARPPHTVGPPRAWRWLFGAFALFAALYMAGRGTDVPLSYDSGLYHFNQIRWVTTYPIVPGLGNLHGRLAFNQTYFPLVALLNMEPWWGHGHNVANGWFVWLLVTQCGWGVTRCVASPARTFRRHPYLALGGALMFAPATYYALGSPFVSSPTPDIATTAAQCALFLLFAEGVARWQRGQRRALAACLAAFMAIGAGVVTMKTSALPMVALATLGGWIAWLYFPREGPRRRMGGRPLAVATIFVVAVAAVWMTRGIVTSGMPVYPLTVGRLDVGWAMPVEAARAEAAWFASWARLPNALPTDPRLHDGSWITLWWGRVWAEHKPNAVAPCALMAASVLAALVVLPARRRTLGQIAVARTWIATFAPTGLLSASLAAWFALAPDVRFAQGVFFSMAPAGALAVLLAMRARAGVAIYRGAATLALAGALAVAVAYPALNRAPLPRPSLLEYRPLPRAGLKQQATESGLMVWLPAGDDPRAWDAPLPASPIFYPGLRLRGDTLAEGFARDTHPEVF